ncbi:MAG: oligosaccharide flippase family protein [Anaerolineales bacterium]
MSLARRSVESGFYNVFSSMLQTGISFFRAVILFRLLTPEVFGLYSYVTAIIIWTGTLPNFGMTGALVHRAPESEGEAGLRVHFTLTLIFNLIWGLVMGVLAVWIIPNLQTRLVFYVILVTQVIDNLSLTGRFKLTRAVVFRRLAVINLLITLISSLAAVTLAYLGYGIWSLVSTDIVAAVMMFAGIYLLRPVWRMRLGWSRTGVRYFLDFGRRAFLSGPLLQALNKFDDIWTGFYLGDTALGFYSRAYSLASYPGTLLASPLNPIAAAAYAELKGAAKKLSLAFMQVNLLLVRTGFYLGGWLAVIAPEFVLIVAGETWLPMVNTFRLMLAYTLLNPLKQTIAGLFGAVGKPEIGVRVQVVQLVVLIICLFLFGIPAGIEGVALAVDVMMVVGIILLLYNARKFVQFSARKLFAVPTLALIVAAGTAWLVAEKYLQAGSVWLTACLKTGLFSIVFAGILVLFEFNDIKELVRFFRRTVLKRTDAMQADPEMPIEYESNDPDSLI